MTVAVVTGHMGDGWDELAALTMPALATYCDWNGYALVDASDDLPDLTDGRPASWGKVQALRVLVDDYDVAVWVDADVLVMPGAPPIHGEVDGYWQALAVHRVAEGWVPNCGVWLVTPPMAPVLAEVWGKVEYLNHVWWEQAAVIDLMGYDMRHHPLRQAPGPLWDRTAVLDTRWNSHPRDDRPDARFRHASGTDMAARLAMVRGWLGEAVPC